MRRQSGPSSDAARITQIQAQLTWNGAPQPVVTFSTAGHSPGDTYALAVQLGTPVTTTGLYPWQLQVTITLPDSSTFSNTFSDYAQVVANDASPFGPGWSMSGLV
jgi:hypothetical protein